MPNNEADTCRKYVVPKLQAAGWDNEPHRINEQVTFTDGRIVVVGSGKRRPGKRADYILRYTRDMPSPWSRPSPTTRPRRRPAAGQGLRRDPRPQVRLLDQRPRHRRVRLLDRPGTELDDFPAPDELWARWLEREKLDPERGERLLTPANHEPGQDAALLPGDRHQPQRRRPSSRASSASCSPWPRAPARPSSPSRSAGSSGRPLERPRRGESPAAHPLPGRPQHPDRRPQGQDVRALRRRPLQDRGRRGRRRAARCTSPSTRPSPRTRSARPLPGVRARLLRPDHRR